MLLDDTPNLRTCLVERAGIRGCEVMQVDILKMTIKDLTDKICKELFLKQPQRLLNLTNNRYYTKEDESMLLSAFEQFNEGGARIEVHEGRYCSENEISIEVEFVPPKENPHNFKEDTKVFYFDSSHSVEQCKYQICDEFGLFKGTNEDEIKKQYLLYRLDNFDDPTHPLRKEKATFEKNVVRFGEKLILKNSKDGAGPGDILKIGISITSSGLPEDSTFIGTLDASADQKLEDVRDMILSMDRFQKKNLDESCLRIREKQNNMFFGRIFRQKQYGQTLKQCGIKGDYQMVVQPLLEPEEIDEKTFVLLMCRRDCKTKTYSQKSEAKFSVPAN